MSKSSFFSASSSDLENCVKDSLLADYVLKKEIFSHKNELKELFSNEEFLKKNEIERWSAINQYLAKWIEVQPEPAFLLSEVVDFIFEVCKAKVLQGTYTLNSFELWLNHYSGLSDHENSNIRAKIVGKKLPRSSYQLFFPISKGKVYFGSHIVTAHSSPDIDTTVASFCGWLDAFAARVGTGLHLWNLPGIEPPSLIHNYFYTWLGEHYLFALSNSSETLFLRAIDLIQSPLRQGENRESESDSNVKIGSKLQEIILAKSRFDEIEQKMESHESLTICCVDHQEYRPIATLTQSFLKKEYLGTVSLRDFSNSEEIKIPSYLQIISVIDHHRCTLKTTTPIHTTISDVQSANVLVAELTFTMNDGFSRLGSQGELLERLNEVIRDSRFAYAEKIIKYLKALELRGEDSSYYIHPKREFLEYLAFLIAILDDTDLLAKAQERDLYCVAELLNRLKSIQLNEVVEMISLDDIPKNELFIKRATRRLLNNEDFYSLYARDFGFKEQELNQQLIQCLRGENLKIFSDTKEQARSARVGQIKFFAKNFDVYLDYSNQLRRIWLKEALNHWNDNQRLKLHLQMISTISGAEEAYYNSELNYHHLDELWMWLPWNQEEAVEVAREFLSKFAHAPEWKEQPPVELEVIGEQCDLWIEIISTYLPCSIKKHELALDRQSIAVLRFKPGLLNSRKLSISPYLTARN